MERTAKQYAFSFNQRERLTLDFTKDIRQQANPKIDTNINIDADDNAITTELHDEKGQTKKKKTMTWMNTYTKKTKLHHGLHIQ